MDGRVAVITPLLSLLLLAAAKGESPFISINVYNGLVEAELPTAYDLSRHEHDACPNGERACVLPDQYQLPDEVVQQALDEEPGLRDFFKVPLSDRIFDSNNEMSVCEETVGEIQHYDRMPNHLNESIRLFTSGNLKQFVPVVRCAQTSCSKMPSGSSSCKSFEGFHPVVKIVAKDKKAVDFVKVAKCCKCVRNQ